MNEQTINKTISKIELEPIEFSSGEGAFKIWGTIEEQKRKVELLRAVVIQKGLSQQQIKKEEKAEKIIANCSCEEI